MIRFKMKTNLEKNQKIKFVNVTNEKSEACPYDSLVENKNKSIVSDFPTMLPRSS